MDKYCYRINWAKFRNVFNQIKILSANFFVWAEVLNLWLGKTILNKFLFGELALLFARYSVLLYSNIIQKKRKKKKKKNFSYKLLFIKHAHILIM